MSCSADFVRGSNKKHRRGRSNLFWKLTEYFLFPHMQSRQARENFANMVNIITLYATESLEKK